MKLPARLVPKIAAAAALLAALAGVTLPELGAEAQGRLRAAIYLTQARIPARMSERQLIAFARRTHARRMMERTDMEVRQRRWEGNLILAFNRPPGDLEFHVLFYDIEDGVRRFVEDMSTFIDDRSQKTYVQRVTLERPRFKPNRRMEIVVTVRRQEVGTARFDMVGEEIRRTGTVDFSEEEAR